MKKIILTILFIALLVPTFVFAKDVEITLNASDIVGYTEETVSVDATILNNQNKQDSFSVTIWPPMWEGVIATLETSDIVLHAASSQTMKIYFDIPINAEEMISVFNLTVKSFTNVGISDSKMINLRIIRKSPIGISSFVISDRTVNPKDTVNLETSVVNRGEEIYSNANLQTKISKSGQTIKTFEETFDVDRESTKKITQSFTLDKYAEPGTYDVDVELRNSNNKLVSSKSDSLNVNSVQNVVNEESIQYGLLLQTVTIKIKNEGNTESSSFYLIENIPNFMKSFFFPTGTWTEQTINDRILYSWHISSLMPGEERTVKYEVNVWYGWIITLVITFSVIIAFRYVFTPSIVKRHKIYGPLTRDSEIIISLDVRNRSRHEIKDVTVTDLVPPILKVASKFETLKPELTKSSIGTELVWNIASLKPLEERVLTYRVKPAIEMSGSLRLPKAMIKYEDRKRIKKTTASKSVLIKPK